jgi:FG-GAP-like repeat
MARRLASMVVTCCLLVLGACGDDNPQRDGGGATDSGGDGPGAADHGAPLGDGPLDAKKPPPSDATKPSPDTKKPPPPPPPKTTCTSEGGTKAVAKPVFVKNIKYTGTSWFASPAIVDLDGDGKKELVGAFYDLIVWDAAGKELTRAKSGSSYHHSSRIYASAVVADLDGDKVTEIVVGAGKGVAAYEYKNKKLSIKSGWPVLAGKSTESYEVRGLAAADLDGDGKIEVVATTTVDGSGSQVWVFSPNGKLYQPAGLTQWKAWPRYNKLSGTGNDADANGMGHHGFGCYGLNVGIGNIDDDKQLEILVTYDNHHINAFNHDGTSKTASSWYKNRDSKFLNKPLDWGQFIRWADPKVEDDHYHLHTGTWPNVKNGKVWLQFTHSPPNVVDINGDGKNEVIGIPNAETNYPYQTIYHAFIALEGDYGTKNRSARRLAGWETLPKTGKPQVRPSGWYPPSGIPIPTSVDLDGDKLPETLVPGVDGKIHAVSPKAKKLWTYDFRFGKSLMYASEVVVADLNKDGTAELIFSTWAKPGDTTAGKLVILNASGKLLHVVTVPNQGNNGNGNGLPAPPGVGDLDGDGALEIVVQSFDHGLDIYKVPGSGTKCLLWPTGRGNLLRNGQGPQYK